MKIAFFTPHVHWPSHYETELELIQEHLIKGDEVIQLVCNAQLPTCDINAEHNLQTCLSCMGCRDYGKQLISGNYIQKSFLNLNEKDKLEIESIRTDFANIKELQSYKIDNFDIGYAVASSIISQLRDPSPDLNKLSQRLKNYLISSLGIYRSVLNFLTENKIDRVYTFNGRYAHVKPVLRACQGLGVDCFVHERGSAKEFYALYKNTTPHDIPYTENRINELWNNTDPEIRVDKGKQFFENRAHGLEKSWFSFTKDQIKGLLPDNWDASKNNIVIFNSSEDEFASIGEEWANPIYKTQLEGIKKILKDVACLPNLHVYLRVHPNLKNVVNEDKKQLEYLRGSNFTLIPANSLISTYDLIQAATRVVSFGSTVGIEATYWGRPSILLGKSFYYNLGGTYNAKSHVDLINLLQADLKPKYIAAALMYGFYMNTYGIPFKYYNAENFFKGRFKNSNVLNTNHIKFKTLNWLLWKPVIRNMRPYINGFHQIKLIKRNYT